MAAKRKKPAPVERVQCLNPEPGKTGMNIEKAKYDAMKKAILRVVPKKEPGLPLSELYTAVDDHLPAGVFEGASTTWYVMSVKLDLEARGILRRVPKSAPQRLVRTQ